MRSVRALAHNFELPALRSVRGEAAELLDISFDTVHQACLLPVAYSRFVRNARYIGAGAESSAGSRSWIAISFEIQLVLEKASAHVASNCPANQRCEPSKQKRQRLLQAHGHFRFCWRNGIEPVMHRGALASACNNHHEFLEGQASDQLLTYDPRTRQTRVVLDGLRNPNGVALGPDETFVLISETIGYTVRKLWLKGPQAGEVKVIIPELPAMPDNITFDRELFWMAAFVERVTSKTLPFPNSVIRYIAAGKQLGSASTF